MDIFGQLNQQQQEAVKKTEGAVLVIAGAGSGKTRVLTYRIAYLMQELGVKPYNILAITFTNKATNEMRERLENLTGEEGGSIWVSTFHAFCTKILRMNISYLGGFTSQFTIYGDQEKDRALKRILCNRGITDKDEIKEEICNLGWHINNAKNNGWTPEEYAMEIDDKDPNFVIEIYSNYQQMLQDSNALDYDDLLMKTKELFTNCPNVLEYYSRKFKYIHIDEYQDTNHLQYELVKMLSTVNGNLFAVGDEDQSIYGWRGANISNILNFRKDFPNATVLKLEKNYRSTNNILKAANALIKNNNERMDKTLWSDLGDGLGVQYYEASSDKNEAEYVATKIKNLVKNEHYELKDIAVLVRINALTRLFEERFNSYDIDYNIVGGLKFYDRKENKDFLAYLRILVNPRDEDAYYRIINTPRRGIGDSVVDSLRNYCANTGKNVSDVLFDELSINDFSPSHAKKLKEFAQVLTELYRINDEKPFPESVKEIYRTINFETMYDREKEDDNNRLLNMEDLIQGIEMYAEDNPGCDLSTYLESISLYSDVDKIQSDDKVTIATIHAVKGLEFRAVFVVGLEEGIMPKGGIMTLHDLEEDRRVLYVAMTRAKEKLFISYAESRYRFGQMDDHVKKSRFLGEIWKVVGTPPSISSGNISSNTYGRVGFSGGKPQQNAIYPVNDYKKAPNYALQSGTIQAKKQTFGNAIGSKVGDKVKHPRFGVGMIIDLDGDNASIAFEGFGVKKLNLTIAPLEKV